MISQSLMMTVMKWISGVESRDEPLPDTDDPRDKV